MARSVRVVLFLLTAMLPVSFLTAEPPPPVPPPPSPPTSADPKKGGPLHGRDDADGALKRFRNKLEKMGPQEREHFKANWERWREMGDRERRDLQGKASEERDRVKKCVDEAIAKTGLTLNADQREVFALRYRQERRKIEEQLSQEITAEREQKVADMLARLKMEFAASAVAAAPSPTTSAPAPAP